MIYLLPEFNLPLIGEFSSLTPPRPYRATTCRERELTLHHIHTFLPCKDMEGLLGWGISSMLGPLPRQHKHESRYTSSTHPFIIIRRLRKDDYAGKMIFGDLLGLKLPDICLTGEEKPRKTSPRKLVPTGDPTRARCVTGAHTIFCSTVMNKIFN